jgi:pimeloyl-ACP methyl ester carboxylesterase
VRGVIPLIKCPSLVIHSERDYLSPQINISLVYDTISSENKEKLIVKNGAHNLFVSNPDQKIIFQTIVAFFNRFREK